MVLKQLAEKITKEDAEELKMLFRRRFFRLEQDRIIQIYESYIGGVVNKSCGKCRSEAIYKIQKLLNLLQ